MFWKQEHCKWATAKYPLARREEVPRWGLKCAHGKHLLPTIFLVHEARFNRQRLQKTLFAAWWFLLIVQLLVGRRVIQSKGVIGVNGIVAKAHCWLCCLLVFASLSDLSRAAVQSRAFAWCGWEMAPCWYGVFRSRPRMLILQYATTSASLRCAFTLMPRAEFDLCLWERETEGQSCQCKVFWSCLVCEAFSESSAYCLKLYLN